MKHKLAAILTAVVTMSLVLAPSAIAAEPLRGPIDTHFNLGFGDETAPCPHITWAGNVELNGTEYGLAWMPLGPPTIDGQWFRVEERWMIYESPFAFEGESLFTECDGNLAMWGDEVAVESLRSLKARGEYGHVDWVNPDGPFDEALVGWNTYWSGVVSDDLLHFPGAFRIYE